MMPPLDAAACADLAAHSARWGNTLDLVQGQGGNTSLKDADTLYVKASGKRLGDALDEDVFVRCDLGACRAAFRAGDEAAATAAVLPGTRLRPSIETLMHAILPGRAVFHFHCVSTIARTVTAPGLGALGACRARLEAAGLSTALVPYAKPGLPLARAMDAAGAQSAVFLLANHGVVIQGPDPEAIEAVLARFLDAVAVAPRVAVDPGLRRAAISDGWQHLTGPDITAFCALLGRLEALRAMTLYPDHAVILGPGIPDGPGEAAQWYVPRDRATIAVRADRAALLMPMIECLIRVALRLDPAATAESFVALDEADVLGLLDWDAEIYRQKMLQGQTAQDPGA